jgi:predicted Zn finger-like uncharacterized protein
MSVVTQCPECGTRFKASQAQLDAYHGMVRCGRCHAAFNAIEQLQGDEPSPQLDLPIELEEFVPQSPAAAVEQKAIPSAAPVYAPAAPQPEPAAEAWFEQPKKFRAWPLVVGSVILLLLVAAQALYFFRVEIAARLPGVKPALVAACAKLQCSVPLPRNADLMSIEYSELQADPAHANIIVLAATLRNHAPYAQAYPNLELTLNDIDDRPVARRTFYPQDYLTSGEQESLGLAAGRELNVKINLDITDLKAAGYRLFLAY